MAAAKDYLSGSGSEAICGAARDWSQLPEDMLVSVLRAVGVVDAIRSGAVCSSWHAAYAAFRRHRLPSPRQPPCLLYSSDAVGPDAAALLCPATGDALQIPFPRPPLPRRPLLGSAHGWLATADEASNLHLLNPVSGAQVALPPITTLHHVESFTDEQGNPMYNLYENLELYNFDTHQYEVDTEPAVLEQRRAYEFVYERVVLSASPSAGRACVVLLLHRPEGEMSFARLGDEGWNWVDDDTSGLPWRFGYRAATYSSVDGLFYLLAWNGAMYSLDLNGPSPVARQVLSMVPGCVDDKKYLVQTPSGDFFQIWRERDLVESSSTPVELPPHYVDNADRQDPRLECKTFMLELYKVNFQCQRVERIQSLPEYALFLGFNDSMCLPVKDFPGLKSNCAYITDDNEAYVNMRKYNRREIGIWSIPDESMSGLDDVLPVSYPWLNWPSPIWIQPSFL